MKNAFEVACDSQMTLKVTQGILYGTIRYGMKHFLLVVCSNVSILNHFRDITTCTVYMTGYDLKKSLRFNTKLKF